jgi:hypothetical protein
MIAALLIAINPAGIVPRPALYASLMNVRDPGARGNGTDDNANALLAAADEAVPALRDRHTH